MDALQAGCHVFIEKPLSTSVQEAVDIVGLARGRGVKVGVGHHLRLLPSLIRARAMLAEGAIGPVRLVTATLALPWLESHRGEEHSWRFDPRFAGGGILADAGVQLIDALLWTTGQAARRGRGDPGARGLRPRPGDGRRGPARRRDPGHAGALRRLARRRCSSGSITASGPAPGDRDRRSSRNGRRRPGGRSPLAEATGSVDADFVAAVTRGAAALLPGRSGARHGPAPGGDRPIGDDRASRPARVSRDRPAASAPAGPGVSGPGRLDKCVSLSYQ